MNFLNVDSRHSAHPIETAARMMAEKYDEDFLFVLSHLLFLQGLAVQGEVTYISSRYHEPLSANMFFIILRRSGGGKTLMYQTIIGPHLAELSNASHEYTKNKAGYDVKLGSYQAEYKAIYKQLESSKLNEDEKYTAREALRALEEKKPQEPTRPTALLDDCTLAALKRTMQSQPCAIATTEGRGVMLRLKDEMMTFTCRLWDGFSFETRDRYKNYPVAKPAFNMFVAMQYSAMNQYMGKHEEDAIEGGLLYRCFIVGESAQESQYSGMLYGNDLDNIRYKKEESEQIEQRFHERITNQIMQRKIRTLMFSPDAEAALQGYIHQLKQLEHDYQIKQMRISGFISKAPEHLRRITVLLHSFSEDGELISASAVHHAAEILNKYTAMQLNFYNPPLHTALVRNAMQTFYWLQQQTGYKKITKRYIQKSCRYAQNDKETLDEQLQYLINQKYIEIIKSGKSEYVNLTTPTGRA